MKYSNITFRVLVLLLLSATLFACKKDNKPSGEKVTLLKKSITNSQTTIYHYDANNRATGFDAVFTNPVNNYTASYTYNNSGKIAEVFYDVSTNDFKTVYFYNAGGQITKIETYVESGGTLVYESKTEAIYTMPGKISVYQTNSGGTPFLNTEYFLDAKGNIIKQQSYNAAETLLSTTEYTGFDDKFSPSRSLPQTAFARNLNNYGTVTVTVPGGTPSTGTYTYEYNNEGYPTKRTQNNGSIVSYEYILIGL